MPKGKPNIFVIFGDDIGAYTHGMMGRTPNIKFEQPAASSN